MKIAIEAISYFLFMAAISYYFATTLQWFSYRLNRALFHHTKPVWNFFYFFLPLGLFDALNFAKIAYAPLIVAIIYVAALYFWYKKLDKPLVFTGRIKRFLLF